MLFLLWHSTERRLFGGLFVCGHSRLLLSWVKLFCFCISFTFWTFLNLIADFSYKKVGFLTLHHNYSRVHLFTCNLWFPLGKRTGVCVCVRACWEGKDGHICSIVGTLYHLHLFVCTRHREGIQKQYTTTVGHLWLFHCDCLCILYEKRLSLTCSWTSLHQSNSYHL